VPNWNRRWNRKSPVMTRNRISTIPSFVPWLFQIFILVGIASPVLVGQVWMIDQKDVQCHQTGEVTEYTYGPEKLLIAFIKNFSPIERKFHSCAMAQTSRKCAISIVLLLTSLLTWNDVGTSFITTQMVSAV